MLAAERRSGDVPSNLDRNLAFELVRVTEAAALASARWMGKGDKIAADQAAVNAMRFALDFVDMDGIVVIGEGEKDEAPMLYTGERIGNGLPPETDIAVDPVDGTTLLSKGMPNAVSVVALAKRGSMLGWKGIAYMEKIAVGPIGKGHVSLELSIEETGTDLLLGIGGSPEAVTTACALRCLGGDLQCRYWPRNDKERQLAEE